MAQPDQKKPLPVNRLPLSSLTYKYCVILLGNIYIYIYIYVCVCVCDTVIWSYHCPRYTGSLPATWLGLVSWSPRIEGLNRTERNSIYHLLTFIETSITWFNYRCQLPDVMHQTSTSTSTSVYQKNINNVNPLSILILCTLIIYTSYILKYI